MPLKFELLVEVAVQGGGVRTVDDPHPRDQRAPAHVGVVVEDEELIDEAAEGEEGLPANQAAGTRDDRHIARLALLAGLAEAAAGEMPVGCIGLAPALRVIPSSSRI